MATRGHSGEHPSLVPFLASLSAFFSPLVSSSQHQLTLSTQSSRTQSTGSDHSTPASSLPCWILQHSQVDRWTD